VKLAGSNRSVSKLSAKTYEALSGSGLSRAETIDANHGSLAVIASDEPPDFDDSDVFALTRGIDSYVSAENQKALDVMIDTAGAKNILHALALLLESRVDESFLQNGMLIHHLARENAFARAAERIHGVASHPDIADISRGETSK